MSELINSMQEFERLADTVLYGVNSLITLAQERGMIVHLSDASPINNDINLCLLGPKYEGQTFKKSITIRIK